MRGVMHDPSQRKKRERHVGPPCPHYPHRFKTEALHQAKLASRRRSHDRMQKSSVDYRLTALLNTIVARCESPKHNSYRWYGQKGIKNFLTLADLKFMWERDGAATMKKASIDRETSDDNYELSKCCFRELRTNQKRGWEKKEDRARAISDGMRRAQATRIRAERAAELHAKIDPFRPKRPEVTHG